MGSKLLLLLQTKNHLIVFSLFLLLSCAQDVTPSVSTAKVFTCLNDDNRNWTSRDFGWTDRCTDISDLSGCSYYDLRQHDLGEFTGFDQRGVTTHQLTFPAKNHLFAALSIDENPDHVSCWIGGAIVGRNPLSMTWSTDSGGKIRKNNFLQVDSGNFLVDGVRIHNTHDIFLATTTDAGFHIRKSWITWNRDDFFEGQLHNLTIEDSLIDGTYNFLSDPDDGCVSAAEKVVTIKNSFIRIQEQPGPYADHTDKWHRQLEGGHNRLYKLDSCSWDEWPRFNLINNVFFIEGPYTTKNQLNNPKCNLALPGNCNDKQLSKLVECKNNIFLYTQFDKWSKKNKQPGPVPVEGMRFYNPDNPDFLINNIDCYQRMTDDPDHNSFEDVQRYWEKRKNAWIKQNSQRNPTTDKVMQVPGIDYSLLDKTRQYRFKNFVSGKCMEANASGEYFMDTCINDDKQWFSVSATTAALFDGGITLIDRFSKTLRSQSAEIANQLQGEKPINFGVFSVPSTNNKDTELPAEHWYILPAHQHPQTDTALFYVESDAMRRSFLRDKDGTPEFQPFFELGSETGIPQNVNNAMNYDPRLLWQIELR